MTFHAETTTVGGSSESIPPGLLDMPAPQQGDLAIADILVDTDPNPAILIDQGREWCELCSPEGTPFDEADAPGMARTVVGNEFHVTALSHEEREAGLTEGQAYEVRWLDCGHSVAVPQ